MLLYFRYLIDYKECDIFIDLKNLFFALIQYNIINVNIANNLIFQKIVKIFIHMEYSISFLLGLVSKYNKSFKKIHYLLYLCSFLINN